MTDSLVVKDYRITNAWAVLMQELGALIAQTFAHFEAFETHMDALRAYEHQKIEEYEKIRQDRVQERVNRHCDQLRSLEDDLIQMLMHPDLALVGAIGTASTGNEKIIQMVVRILDSYGKLVSLLTVAVTREVTTTQDHSTLFRGNSPSTKLMTAFTRILGKDYLDIVLKPFVEALVEEDPALYEVDPAKSKEGDVEENMQRLLVKCQEILDIILDSLGICPPSFRMVTKHLQREVVKRFPDSKNTCVGGFFFLRYLCPVLMSPDVLGLIDGPIDKSKRRPLTLICKALQNLSNNIRFGKKEAYMLPVNTFLDDNLDRTNKFFEDFVQVSDDISWEPLAKLEDVRKNEVKQLHEYTKENIAKIGRYLAGTSPPELVMEIVRLVADLDSAYEYGDEHPELARNYVPTASSSSLQARSARSNPTPAPGPASSKSFCVEKSPRASFPAAAPPLTPALSEPNLTRGPAPPPPSASEAALSRGPAPPTPGGGASESAAFNRGPAPPTPSASESALSRGPAPTPIPPANRGSAAITKSSNDTAAPTNVFPVVPPRNSPKPNSGPERSPRGPAPKLAERSSSSVDKSPSAPLVAPPTRQRSFGGMQRTPAPAPPPQSPPSSQPPLTESPRHRAPSPPVRPVSAYQSSPSGMSSPSSGPPPLQPRPPQISSSTSNLNSPTKSSARPNPPSRQPLLARNRPINEDGPAIPERGQGPNFRHSHAPRYTHKPNKGLPPTPPNKALPPTPP
uniref:Ras-GAP domain-containing protein n=1 Tax=Paramoeba aestuarina TaxID=180227 RepID=A0A7S4KY45_9EUKA